MRHNANLVLRGARCTLVPYRREHVPRYHEWMKDPAIREATASEPLSIEEEHAMQEEWAADESKCTFILCDNTLPPGVGAMCGDVNIFLNDHDDPKHTAEIEIMVAEQGSRRKGIAVEALEIFMSYCHMALGVKTFRAKIGFDNAPSLALFRDKMKFREKSSSDVFREVTLEHVSTFAVYVRETVGWTAARWETRGSGVSEVGIEISEYDGGPYAPGRARRVTSARRGSATSERA